MEDETVVTVMNEIKMLDEIERASGPTGDDSSVPPGKFSAAFVGRPAVRQNTGRCRNF